jgi:transcriptional regulator with XRE-family HTH domain
MKRLKVERKKRKWPQIVPAYKAKLAVSDYSRIESGRTQPYPAQLKRLAKVFGLEPAVLLEEVDESAVSLTDSVEPRPPA